MPTHRDVGFVMADSRNLPKMKFSMIAVYMMSPDWFQPELRNVKTVRSGRPEYGDEAIGFVQLKEETDYTHVKASVCPETRVHGKKYTVNCLLNDYEILKAYCEDCVASQGGCKHAVALIFWLLRKTLEPSPTSVENYWVAPNLGKVGSQKKVMPSVEMKPALKPKMPEEKNTFFFNMSVDRLEDTSHDVLMQRQFTSQISLSIHSLIIQFEKTSGSKDGNAFLAFCSSTMTDKKCIMLASETKSQCDSSLWYELRYARITASKVYDASRCSVDNGSLVKSIMGAVKIRDTDAMRRGRMLEPKVLRVVEKLYSNKIRNTGLVLRKDHPIFGASPDGILGNYIVEVKCPTSDETFLKYFNKELTAPSNKYLAQMHLQMLMCRKFKGLFCVANANFEKNNVVKIVEVSFDGKFLQAVLRGAEAFWLKCIFPKILHQ